MNKSKKNLIRIVVNFVINNTKKYYKFHRNFPIYTRWFANWQKPICSTLFIKFLNRSEGTIYAKFAGMITAKDNLKKVRSLIKSHRKIQLFDSIPLNQENLNINKYMNIHTLEKHRSMGFSVTVKTIIDSLSLEDRINQSHFLNVLRYHFNKNLGISFYLVFYYQIGRSQNIRYTVDEVHIKPNDIIYNIMKEFIIKE